MRALWSCLLIVLDLIAPCAVASEPIKIRATVQVPVTEPFLGASVGRFKEEVEKETGNAIVVEIFDRGKLYIDDQVVDAVRSGAVEMGVAGLNQINRILPAASLLEQPFLFNFDALVRAATSPDSELRKLIDDAVLKTIGVRVLWWQTIGPQVIFTKDGDAKEPNRIKDKKIRSFSPTTSSFAKHCGGVPLVVSTSQIQQALGDGTLDMAMISAAGVQTRDLWKVTNAITRTDHAAVEFLVVINEKTWQSLSDKHKSILTQAARRVERDVRERSSELEAAAYDFARSKGMKIHELAPHEVAEWRACSSGVLIEYMDKGGELTQLLMNAYGKLRTDPCCSAGPQGDAKGPERPRIP
jgi:C4-dicarboxylate-binding protein DctP